MRGMADGDDLIAEEKVGYNGRILYREAYEGNIHVTMQDLVYQGCTRSRGDRYFRVREIRIQ
jgi:hypothetical protein